MNVKTLAAIAAMLATTSISAAEIKVLASNGVKEALEEVGIAYEHEGQLEKARKAYEKAIELDPNNSQVRQNYELFKEINDRTTRKDSQDTPDPDTQ